MRTYRYRINGRRTPAREFKRQKRQAFKRLQEVLQAELFLGYGLMPYAQYQAIERIRQAVEAAGPVLRSWWKNA